MIAIRARYLLDTNVISEPLRPEPNPRVLARLRETTGQLAIASVVWHELLFGWERMRPSRKRDYLGQYLHQVVRPGCEFVPYDEAAAQWHAQARARLERRGRATSFADGQVAAIAVTGGFVLVTRNVKDFEPYEEVELEDWFVADV